MQIGGLPEGFIFARDYRVVRFLAEGGMGRVYVAEQLSTGKERALKVMRLEQLQGQDVQRRFVQEARLSACIDSDHVPEVLAAGVDELTGLPFIAMELLHGETLESYLTTHGPMPIGHLVEIFAQLSHALIRGHALGIVHRDLKPENVFLAHAKRRGATFTVKLLDFGIAKVLGQGALRTTSPIGTPLYMAPEQFAGHSITAAVDVWALGLIAFRALTGAPYWLTARKHDTSAIELMHEVSYSALEPASQRAKQIGATLPAEFDSWFSQCIERDIRKRFASVTEAFFVFESLFGSQAVTLTPALPPVVAPSYRPPPTTTLPYSAPPSAPSSRQHTVVSEDSQRKRATITLHDRQDASATSLNGESLSLRQSRPSKPPRGSRVLLFSGVLAAGSVTAALGALMYSEQRAELAPAPRLTVTASSSSQAAVSASPPPAPPTAKPAAPEPPSLDKLAQRCSDDDDAAACLQAGQRRRLGEVSIPDPPATPRVTRARDIESAISLLAHGCDLGGPRACREVGLIYWRADGVQQDVEKARSYFERVCSSRTAEGCELLGDLYDMGAGRLPIDLDRGLALDQQGCDGDEPIGCLQVAQKGKLSEGRDAAERARSLLQQRCRRGSAEHCGRLGTESRFGGVIPRDLALAEESLRSACRQSHMPSCVQLGSMYEKGEAAAPNASAATQLYRLACQMGEPSGCDKVNATQAKQLRVESCDRGDYLACYTLGQRAGLASRKAEAHDYLSRACQQGYRAACFESAELLQRSPELDPNPRLAQERMQRACDLRYKDACKHELLTTKPAPPSPDELRAQCARGDAQSCLAWGDDQSEKQCLNTTKKQWQWAYQRACDGDVAAACHQLARCIFSGSPSPIEAQRGTKLMAKSCLELDYDIACREYSDRLYGACLSSDAEDCPSYFALACVFKHKQACRRLDSANAITRCYDNCTSLAPAKQQEDCLRRCMSGLP